MPNRIRTLLRDRGIKPVRIAADLDVSLSSVYEWMSGRQVPGVDKALALASMLGVTVEELFTPSPDSVDSAVDTVR